MTTKHSPPAATLRAQAGKIAAHMKAAERADPHGRKDPVTFKCAIIMDDKTLMVEAPWVTIAETAEPALVEWVFREMSERRNQ